MFMVQKLLELASYIKSKWSSSGSNLQSLLVRSQLDICLLPSSRPEQSVDFGHVTMTRHLHRLFELVLVDLNISDGKSLSLSSILFTVCSVVSVTLLMAQKLVPLGWDAPSVSWAAQGQVVQCFSSCLSGYFSILFSLTPVSWLWIYSEGRGILLIFNFILVKWVLL